MNDLNYNYKKPNNLQINYLQNLITKGLLKEGNYLPLYINEIATDDEKEYAFLVVSHDNLKGEINALVLLNFTIKDNEILNDSFYEEEVSTTVDFIKRVVLETRELTTEELITFDEVFANLLGAHHMPIAKLIGENSAGSEYLVISKIVVPNSKSYAQFLVLKANDK